MFKHAYYGQQQLLSREITERSN